MANKSKFNLELGNWSKLLLITAVGPSFFLGGGWGPGIDLGPGPLMIILCLSSRGEVGRKGWDTGVGLEKGPCILASVANVRASEPNVRAKRASLASH